MESAPVNAQSASAMRANRFESGTISESMPWSDSLFANRLPSPPGSDSATVTLSGRRDAISSSALLTVLE